LVHFQGFLFWYIFILIEETGIHCVRNVFCFPVSQFKLTITQNCVFPHLPAFAAMLPKMPENACFGPQLPGISPVVIRMFLIYCLINFLSAKRVRSAEPAEFAGWRNESIYL
jgi:hypothetical protein